MTDPISFPSSTPRHALPLLFAGQAQKEVTVNEGLALADLLLQPCVQATLATPPTTPAAGQCWIVGSGATGAFAGHDNAIAAWIDGGWRFLAPTNGMQIYDVAHAAYRTYVGGWTLCTAPSAVSGGTVIDVQARAAISALAGLLVTAGIFSAG